MENQIMLAELPPLDITEGESGLATVRVNMSGYPIHSAAYNNTAELVCRERQLREALAQLRAANERAEYLQGEHDYRQRLYRASEEERAELLVRAEAAEAKLAAVPDAEGAD